jgi:hypothetical protein
MRSFRWMLSATCRPVLHALHRTLYGAVILLTVHRQLDQFTSYRVRVDRAPVVAAVVETHVAHLQVPPTDFRPKDGVSGVVDHPAVVVRQRDGTLVKPCQLQMRLMTVSFNDKAVVMFTWLSYCRRMSISDVMRIKSCITGLTV